MSDPDAFAACVAWDGRVRPEDGDGLLFSVNYAETREVAREALLTRSREPGFLDGEVVEGHPALQDWLKRFKDHPLP